MIYWTVEKCMKIHRVKTHILYPYVTNKINIPKRASNIFNIKRTILSFYYLLCIKIVIDGREVLSINLLKCGVFASFESSQQGAGDLSISRYLSGI